MKTDAKKVMEALKRLPREAQIEIAKTLLAPVRQQKGEEFNMRRALDLAMRMPAPYRYPLCQCLLEADKMFQEDILSKDDVANMAGALLWMTQEQSDQQEESGLRIPHASLAEMQLQNALNSQ